MRAIVPEGFGSPDVLRVREIDRPVPAEGEVVVRVVAASVNALDWHMLKRLPHLIGRLLRQPKFRGRGADFAGLVEAVGPGVSGLVPGDEVFGVARGSYAEYALSLEDKLAPKPRKLTFEQAAAMPVAGLTALQGLRDQAGLAAGQRVLVHGAGGGVGTFAVPIAKALGAHVTAVSTTANLDLLRSIGADEVIDYTREDFVDRGGPYDVFFDVGGTRSFADCRRVLTPNGVIVIVGAQKRILARLLAAQWRSRVLKQRIVWFMARVTRADLAVLGELADAGQLTPVIARTFTLGEVPEALRLFGAGHPRGKIVIRVGL